MARSVRALTATVLIATAFLLGGADASLAQSADGPAAEPAPQSRWKILEYDAQGRVTGVREGGGRAAPSVGSERPAPESDAPAFEKPVEPGELLIAEPPPGAEALLERLGFSIRARETFDALEIDLWRVDIPEGMSLPEALRALRREMPEAIVDTNDILDLSSDRVQLAQSQRDFARAAVGWGPVPESCGKGMVLGQIDGAVDTDHPALADRALLYRNFIGEEDIPAAEEHGTAIAIMLVGKPRPGRVGGLLPGATLYAANIFKRIEGGEKGNLAAMLRAIEWLVANGVQVANLSVTGGANMVMHMVVQRATAKGLMIVAAAGNHGPAAQPAWPAAAEQSLAVTAIDRSLKLYPFANRGPYIDFAAPGVDLVTETPTGLREQSGTSMATPFVTAMVALHLEAGYPADPDRIRQSLKRYAHDLGESGRDSDFGYGLVRLRPQCAE